MIDARVETEPLLREASTSDLYPEAMESSEIRRNDDGPEGEEGSDQNNRSQGGALHMERNHKHATSNMETMIHLLKGNIGTGVQAMPDALKNSGLAFGSIGVVLMGVVCIHCMHMLVDACHELCGRLRFTSMDYADVSFHAFRVGPEKWRKFAVASRRIVNVFLCLTQFGFCCVYYVYVAKNLQTFMTDHVQFDMSVHAYMGIIFIPFALLTFVKSLKYLSPISMIANVLQAVGTAIIFYFLLRDLKPVGDRPMVAPISRWPLYFGTAIYAFEGIGIVLPLENKMKTPRDFVGWTGVLNTGMVIVTCLYTATGFFGYLEYGDDVKGSVTLNLPPGNIWAAAVQLMMTLAIFFSYALQFYVPVEILWPHVKARLPNEQYSVLTNFLFRIALVFMTFALAALIPNIGLFISLVGAVSSSFLALIFPPILDSVVFWNEVSQVRLCKNIAITLFGILGFVTGTYATLAQVFTGDDTI